MEALAEAAAGEALEKMRQAFSLADGVLGENVLSAEEVVRVVKCPGER